MVFDRQSCRLLSLINTDLLLRTSFMVMTADIECEQIIRLDLIITPDGVDKRLLEGCSEFVTILINSLS